MNITGTTRVWGILADPIHHVKTPQALNPMMVARGVDGVMVPMHVGAGALAAVVGAMRHVRNFGGFVVTVPHKTAIAALCDEASETVRRVGAANCVRREADGRFVADMLDGKGFVAGLKREGIDPEGMGVLLAGAGGAANAIAFALAEAGVKRLAIANRTKAKSDDLAARLSKAFPALPVTTEPGGVGGYALVVNATSLGLSEGDPLPVDIAGLTSGQTVAEVIMQPAETALMAAARARGCHVHPGKPMLECQLDLMADFLGMRA
ncbi:shikimate dehydrogenase [Chelatococcus sp. XZ-Ab1]|uniref:shikimate dehydrogenase family protein n=1 Tax=Chelatococcus sp. XZ-Ab1 TaxID=3034027 RepID=UPI0023E3E551|nr:shikimate dehydrogenase [Chelatococcus sp. XZ-Ab1]